MELKSTKLASPQSKISLINFERQSGRANKACSVRVGQYEGPHECRFTQDDSFDKSLCLTRNPNNMMTL